MILIITNKADYTADYLILKLNLRKIDFVRLNTEDFPQSVELSLYIGNRTIQGNLKIANRIIDLQSIKSIWFRRPRQSQPSDEISDSVAREFILTESNAVLTGLWRLLPCFWVSHPDKIKIADSKLYQLKIAKDLGFVIPKTLVTNSPHEATSFYQENEEIIYKPLRKGRIVRNNSTHLIYTSLVGKSHAEKMGDVNLAPVLFQPNIAKKTEIRATVVGSRVFAVEIQSQKIDESRIDWRRANTRDLIHRPYELPSNIQSLCVSLVKKLGLAFGAIDLIKTLDDEFIFLEINPNGQWAWIQEVCPEIHIREALIELLLSGEVSE